MTNPTPDEAELLLHAGEFEKACEAAQIQCERADDADCTRLLSVMLQADFHLGRLKSLQELQAVSCKPLGALGIQVVLLWGVIALELDKLQEAKQVLAQYIEHQAGVQLLPDDAVALARLYAVWLLGKAASSSMAARSWLHQQQQLQLRPQDVKDLMRELDELDATRLASSLSAQQHHHKARAAFAAQQQQHGHPHQARPGAAAMAGPAGPGAARHASAAQHSSFVTMTGSMEEIWDAAVLQGSAAQAAQQQARDKAQHGSSTGGIGATVRGWASSIGSTASGAWQMVTGSSSRASSSSSGAGGASGEAEAGPRVDRTVAALGAGLAVVVAYSLYAERQNIRKGLRKGAHTVRRGAAEVLGMALGLAPSPMAAVPSTRHLQ